RCGAAEERRTALPPQTAQAAARARRTAALTSGSPRLGSDCSGSFVFDLNTWLRSGADPALQSGVALYAQYWSRDPLASVGNVNFSNAVALRVCP
ncbi:MAG: hypothetical protein ACKO4Q_18840, partial [Planctomycetota bacterium]